jgi:hypothetical protein
VAERIPQSQTWFSLTISFSGEFFSQQSRFGFTPVVSQAQDKEFERFTRQDTLEIIPPLEWWNEPTQERSHPNLQQTAFDILLYSFHIS